MNTGRGLDLISTRRPIWHRIIHIQMRMAMAMAMGKGKGMLLDQEIVGKRDHGNCQCRIVRIRFRSGDNLPRNRCDTSRMHRKTGRMRLLCWFERRSRYVNDQTILALVTIWLTPPQKACSNCRRAKLKCIVNDGENECVRCTSRSEKCVFFPRSHASYSSSGDRIIVITADPARMKTGSRPSHKMYTRPCLT